MKEIEQHPVYQEVLKDSFGGIMYNVANKDKYDATEVIELWDNLTPVQRESANGIITGAMHFLKGDY